MRHQVVALGKERFYDKRDCFKMSRIGIFTNLCLEPVAYEMLLS